MKLSFFIICFLLIYQTNSYSQSNDFAVAKCEFKFTHRYDTTNFEKKIIENYTLLLGKESSQYLSKDRVLQDSLMLDNANKTGFMAPPSTRRYNSEKIYFFQKEKSLFITANSLMGKYIIEKSSPKLDWKLFKDTIHFFNYVLNKATTSYHGRNYICWYAPSLPFKAGPWKINGLPGLIFKLYDETNRINFELTSFTATNVKDNIKWDDNYKIILWDDYLKMIYFFRDDPDGFIQSKFPGMSITSLKAAKPKNRTILEQPTYVNFPLEDKKFLIEK